MSLESIPVDVAMLIVAHLDGTGVAYFAECVSRKLSGHLRPHLGVVWKALQADQCEEAVSDTPNDDDEAPAFLRPRHVALSLTRFKSRRASRLLEHYMLPRAELDAASWKTAYCRTRAALRKRCARCRASPTACQTCDASDEPGQRSIATFLLAPPASIRAIAVHPPSANPSVPSALEGPLVTTQQQQPYAAQGADAHAAAMGVPALMNVS